MLYVLLVAFDHVITWYLERREKTGTCLQCVWQRVKQLFWCFNKNSIIHAVYRTHHKSVSKTCVIFMIGCNTSHLIYFSNLTCRWFVCWLMYKASYIIKLMSFLIRRTAPFSNPSHTTSRKKREPKQCPLGTILKNNGLFSIKVPPVKGTVLRTIKKCP